MVRVGGLGYRIDVTKPQGERISDLTLLKSGETIDPAKSYVVAGVGFGQRGHRGAADLGCDREPYCQAGHCDAGAE